MDKKLSEIVTARNGGTRVRSIRTGMVYRVVTVHVTYVGLGWLNNPEDPTDNTVNNTFSMSRDDLNEFYELA